GEAVAEPAGAENAAGHRQELMPFDFQGREDGAERRQVASAEWLLVGGAGLAGVRQAAARPGQERVVAPRLAEDGDAAGPQDAVQFAGGAAEVEVVQDGIAPD